MHVLSIYESHVKTYDRTNVQSALLFHLRGCRRSHQGAALFRWRMASGT